MTTNTDATTHDGQDLLISMKELRQILQELDGKYGDSLAKFELKRLVFKPGFEVELGLEDPRRRVVYRGDVIRKSDNKVEWLDIHLILLDNFLIMTKRRKDADVERLYVSKRVLPLRLFITFRSSPWTSCNSKHLPARQFPQLGLSR